MRWTACLSVVGAAFLLAGCAQWPLSSGAAPASSGALADVATESDESPQRRRARLRLELSAAYLQDGQPQVALDEVKQAIAIDPAFSDAFNLRGLVYLRLNNAVLAADSFERALLLNPRDATVAHNLALLRCQQGRFEEAQRYFSQALVAADHASQPRNWVAQALCQANAGRPLAAEASLVHALGLDVADPTAAFHLARLLFERGEPQAARLQMLKLSGASAPNAASLWLGIRIERQLNNSEAVLALAEQLRARFAQSRELSAYDRGAFHE